MSATTVLLLCLALAAGGEEYDGSERTFHKAARTGDVAKVKAMLAAGQRIDALDSSDSTALSVATYWGQADVVRVLLDHGANVHAGSRGMKPLPQAARQDNEEVVKMLLAAGADVRLANHKGETPLHHAATKEIAKLLVDHGAAVGARTASGLTPLHLAQNGGVAEFLINAGADLSAVAKGERWGGGGGTPLYVAVEYARWDVVETLAVHGANLEAINAYDGRTPLLMAARVADSKEPVGMMLDRGADINARNAQFGWTPLMEAMLNNRLETAALLIERGADVTVRDVDGKTALHLAVWLNSPELVRMLIARGADVNARSKFNTSLGQARSAEVAEILRSHGAVK